MRPLACSTGQVLRLWLWLWRRRCWCYWLVMTVQRRLDIGWQQPCVRWSIWFLPHVPRPEDTTLDLEGVWAGDPPQQAAWPKEDAGPGRAAAVCQPAATTVVRDEAGLLSKAGQPGFKPRQGGRLRDGGVANRAGTARRRGRGQRRRRRRRCCRLGLGRGQLLPGKPPAAQALRGGLHLPVGRHAHVAPVVEDVFILLGPSVSGAAAVFHVEAGLVGRQPPGALVVLRRDFEGRLLRQGRGRRHGSLAFSRMNHGHRPVRLPGLRGEGRGHGFLTFSRIILGHRLSRPPGCKP